MQRSLIFNIRAWTHAYICTAMIGSYSMLKANVKQIYSPEIIVTKSSEPRNTLPVDKVPVASPKHQHMLKI